MVSIVGIIKIVSTTFFVFFLSIRYGDRQSTDDGCRPC